MNGTTLLTWLKGRYIDSDQYGNAYYEERFYFGAPKDRKPRRWVIYKGIPEASKVPPEWHAWIHFTTDVIPQNENALVYEWQKAHMPNLTGTKKAYMPPKDRKATYYEAWKPGQ